MTYRVFIKVFFEKPAYLIIYSLSIVTFWFVMFIGIASDTYSAHYEKNMPDIEINGGMADPENSFLLYEDLDPSIRERIAQEGVTVYGLTARELEHFCDAYYQVSYRIIGADDEFFNELSGYLKRGRLPESGKAEAVIGSSAAVYYGLRVGDVIDLPVTLEESPDAADRKYTVSGIIAEQDSFFGSGIFLSKDADKSGIRKAADNILYVYTANDAKRRKISLMAEEWTGMDGFGKLQPHYEYKASLGRTIRLSLLKTIPLSAIVLTVLFVSLMKYTSRKIGLMKALGISDRHIMKLLIKGFAVYNMVGVLLSYLSMSFVRLSLGAALPASVILYSVYSFGIIFAVTIVILYILCRKISPRLAMYPY